jgi:hypothetical protein
MESPQFYQLQEVQQYLQSSGTASPAIRNFWLTMQPTYDSASHSRTYGTCWFQFQVLYGNLVTTFKRVLVK